jgi:hypothetical protein
MSPVRLSLAPPSLLVLRLTTAADPDAFAAARRAWSMPTAPYGSPVWQLPVILAYAGRLRHTQQPPELDTFAAFLQERRDASPLPVPLTPYRGDPLHDLSVMYWLDLRIQPRKPGELWPGISLVLVEQDTSPCRTGGTLITRRHGPRELAELARTRAHEPQGRAERELRPLAAQLRRVREWTDNAVKRLDAEEQPAAA